MKKNTQKFLKGLGTGLIISGVANWITFSDLQVVNILVGGGIGVALFFIFDVGS